MNRYLTVFHLVHLLAATIIGVLALLVFAFVLEGCKPSGVPLSVTSPLSTPALNSTQAAIREMLALKATQVVQVEQTKVSARFTPYPKILMPTLDMVRTPDATAFAPIMGSTPAGAGALVQVAPPFSNIAYHIENTWYVDLDGGKKRVFVYAGSVSGEGGQHTSQGVVIVWVLQISSQNDQTIINNVETKRYLTPVQAGAVKIVDAKGDRLILQSTNGSTFYFDLPSRQFVSSLTVVVPTATVSISPPATPAPAP